MVSVSSKKTNRISMKKLLLLLFAFTLTSTTYAQLGGFSKVTWATGFTKPVDMEFSHDGAGWVWTVDGLLWRVDPNNSNNKTLILNLSEEVGSWRDHGGIGIALSPNFANNRQVFLSYVVDRHYLMNFGTGSYNSNSNDYNSATIARVTRFTVNSSFTGVESNSRLELVGKQNDYVGGKAPCIIHESHGCGGLAFGTDGSLLASFGDSGSYNSTDEGSASETYYQQALNDGIITNAQNIGAYRAQSLESLNGKLLRINPNNGEGYPSNPWFDGNVNSIRSKILAVGLRNPFKLSSRYGTTGDHDQNQGNPADIIVGDVGWADWESIHIWSPNRIGYDGEENFGWPLVEGVERLGNTQPTSFGDSDAPYFDEGFRILGGAVNGWHDPAQLAWRNGKTAKGYINFNAVNVGSGQLPGPNVQGNSSSGGVWYESHSLDYDANYPSTYHNSLFIADYGGGWIRNVTFDAQYNPTGVRDFGIFGEGGIVNLEVGPDGWLYVINVNSSQIYRIEFTGNSSPSAFIEASTTSGTTPLTVQFDGSLSADVDGSITSYSWNFGDGNTSNAASPTHTFQNANNGSPTQRNVTLTVFDNNGASAQATKTISINNTPPTIVSSSLDGTCNFDPNINTTLNLTASATDNEHSSGQLTYKWVLGLYHNDHNHDEAPIFGQNQTALITPVPEACGGASAMFWYRITLTVSDPAGASTTIYKDCFADCSGTPQVITFNNIPDKLTSASPFTVSASSTSGLSPVIVLVDGPAQLNQINNTVTLTGQPGFVTLRAYQTGNGTYQPAPPVDQTFRVGPTINANNPPVANFTATPTSGPAPLSVSVNASSSSDPDGDNLSYSWNFGNGQTGTGVTSSVNYSGAGTYTITLTVNDGTTTDTETRNITVTTSNNPPVANFTATPSTGEAPLVVTFNGSASSDPDNDGLTYLWDFGDGTTTGGNATINHTYQNAGAYTARLTVSDGTLNNSTTRTVAVTQANRAPSAVATVTPTSGAAPLNVLGIGASSTDPDGDLLSYNWNFGNGQTATGVNANAQYTTAGIFTVTLTVSDGSLSDTDTKTVTVTSVNNPPTANMIASPTTGNAPLTVTFNSLGSFDPDGDNLTFSWNFGDGMVAAGATTTHQYTTAGTYTATLTVSDGTLSATDTQIITVSGSANQAPTAAITASPTSGQTPLAVTVSGAGSTDPDGDNLTYTWNFGNGNTASTVAANTTYSSAGTYTITLTVSDGSLSDQATQVISVSGVSNTPPNAVISATPTSGTAPLSVTFNGTGSSDPDNDNLTYAWNFGDGNGASTAIATNQYTTAGSYTATLTVSDGTATDQATQVISVNNNTNNAPTAALLLDNSSGETPLLVSFDASGSSDPDNDNLTYTFDFDNGATVTGSDCPTPQMVYNTAGSYTVTLTVNDGTTTDQITRSITVTEGDCGQTGSEIVVDFANTPTVSYTTQDVDGNVEVQDNGATLYLEDNTWRRTEQTYTITANTVLAFNFKSTAEGEIQGIGFDNNDVLNQNETFQLYGTSTWGNQTYNNYNGNGQYTAYTIPIGTFITGTYRITFINDFDLGQNNTSYFNNVRLIDGTVNNNPPSAPTSLTATAASASQINLAWQDNANNETGFSVERRVGAGSFAVVASLSANTTSYQDGSLLANTAYSYRVRASNSAGSSAYTNTATATTQQGQSGTLLDFDTDNVTAFSTQYRNGNTTSQESGDALFLDGNNWQRTIRTFNLTPNSVLEFEFKAGTEGEIHGIGFDADDNLSINQYFQLHGTQVWGNQTYNNYSGNGQYQTYSIPVGTLYTGSNMRVIFINDKDAAPFNSSSTFRNVRVIE